MSKKIRTLPLALAAILVPMVVATVAVTWAGGRPSSASAAPSGAEMLGVDEGSAVELGSEVAADEKLDEAVDRSVASAAAVRVMAPAIRNLAPVPQPKPVARKVVAKASVKKAPAKKATSSSGWKTARVTWYGPGLYGNTMAGGGKLQPNSMIVAHRSLPFGTRIEFSYKGKTCIAVVQDRGPFAKGLVFDLGPGVAKALGFGGVGNVSYRFL